jgi:hypothetical protein
MKNAYTHLQPALDVVLAGFVMAMMRWKNASLLRKTGKYYELDLDKDKRWENNVYFAIKSWIFFLVLLKNKVMDSLSGCDSSFCVCGFYDHYEKAKNRKILRVCQQN